MASPEPLSYERATWRIGRLMAAGGILGAACALAFWGWRAGAGFVAGALISAVQFLWLKGLVDGLAGPPKRGRALRLALRFLALAGASYVIFRLIPVSVPAAFSGVFLFTAAVFAEVTIEIVYARK